MCPKKKIDYDRLKQLLTTNEGLGIICFNKHTHKGKINCTKISEVLKIPINKIKSIAAEFEEIGILKTNKAGQDIEIEMTLSGDERARHIVDEVVWENKQEYGKIYKQIITAELLEFMDGK